MRLTDVIEELRWTLEKETDYPVYIVDPMEVFPLNGVWMERDDRFTDTCFYDYIQMIRECSFMSQKEKLESIREIRNTFKEKGACFTDRRVILQHIPTKDNIMTISELLIILHWFLSEYGDLEVCTMALGSGWLRVSDIGYTRTIQDGKVRGLGIFTKLE